MPGHISRPSSSEHDNWELYFEDQPSDDSVLYSVYSCGISPTVAEMLISVEEWALELIPHEIYADLDYLHPNVEERCCTRLVTDLPNPYDEEVYTEYQAWYEGEIECPSPESTPGEINSQGFGRLIERRRNGHFSNSDLLEMRIQIGLFDHAFQPVFTQDEWLIFEPDKTETNVVSWRKSVAGSI